MLSVLYFYFYYSGTYSTSPTSPLYIVAGVIIFLNGVTMLAFRYHGRICGRISDEVKGRPQYIVAEKKGFGPDEERQAMTDRELVDRTGNEKQGPRALLEFRVGAALLCRDGRVYRSCNVETRRSEPRSARKDRRSIGGGRQTSS